MTLCRRRRVMNPSARRHPACVVPPTSAIRSVRPPPLVLRLAGQDQRGTQAFLLAPEAGRDYHARLLRRSAGSRCWRVP
jgi:hypothetical protein